MKKSVNILLIAFFALFSGLVQAQKTVSDTLAYAKKFQTNKEKYIGKKFSLLLKDMTQLSFKKAKSDIKEDGNNPLPGTLFRFSDKDIDASGQVTVVIKWKPDDTPTTPLEFFEQEHNYGFTVNEKNFFENKIIQDIVVYKQ
ncbi:hypothetical protein [uncultured Chryseobacterium sp.]|uniref:hypothetical protein n=1 Tax=uncultured Chryseobacterium sp. TaxID=259322 RepID=UPI0025EF0B2E|nr:hypothetical protein [uncultured Chryseobacterium sp.]